MCTSTYMARAWKLVSLVSCALRSPDFFPFLPFSMHRFHRFVICDFQIPVQIMKDRSRANLVPYVIVVYFEG